jgi:hypothetical protein
MKKSKFMFNFWTSLSESFSEMSNWAKNKANKIYGGETNGE